MTTLQAIRLTLIDSGANLGVALRAAQRLLAMPPEEATLTPLQRARILIEADDVSSRLEVLADVLTAAAGVPTEATAAAQDWRTASEPTRGASST